MKHLYRVFFALACIVMLAFPFEALSQRSSKSGGSFGGSRSSGRSYSTPRSSPRSGGGSFGGSRSRSRSERYAAPPSRNSSPSAAPYSAPRRSASPSVQNSFGGTRLQSSQEYTSRYGTPRRTEKRSLPLGGSKSNYIVHSYGGMGDGFMMGYLMGSAPWYYHMPFHPAYYYSAPYTVVNPDGTTSVYPGQFSAGTLVFTILLLGGGGYIIYVWYRTRKRRLTVGSTDMSQSSFG
jgi:hypothetical protein